MLFLWFHKFYFVVLRPLYLTLTLQGVKYRFLLQLLLLYKLLYVLLEKYLFWLWKVRFSIFLTVVHMFCFFYLYLFRVVKLLQADFVKTSSVNCALCFILIFLITCVCFFFLCVFFSFHCHIDWSHNHTVTIQSVYSVKQNKYVQVFMLFPFLLMRQSSSFIYDMNVMLEFLCRVLPICCTSCVPNCMYACLPFNIYHILGLACTIFCSVPSASRTEAKESGAHVHVLDDHVPHVYVSGVPALDKCICMALSVLKQLHLFIDTLWGLCHFFNSFFWWLLLLLFCSMLSVY